MEPSTTTSSKHLAYVHEAFSLSVYEECERHRSLFYLLLVTNFWTLDKSSTPHPAGSLRSWCLQFRYTISAAHAILNERQKRGILFRRPSKGDMKSISAILCVWWRWWTHGQIWYQHLQIPKKKKCEMCSSTAHMVAPNRLQPILFHMKTVVILLILQYSSSTVVFVLSTTTTTAVLLLYCCCSLQYTWWSNPMIEQFQKIVCERLLWA